MDPERLKNAFWTSILGVIIITPIWIYSTFAEPETPMYVKGSRTELAPKEYSSNGILKEQAVGWRNQIQYYDRDDKPHYADEDPFLVYFYVFICIPIMIFVFGMVIMTAGLNVLDKIGNFIFK
jgi:hypothetical protein